MSHLPRVAQALLLSLIAVSLIAGCSDDKRKKKVGDFCSGDTECADGICYASECLDPDGDYDGDGLKNGVEKHILGTDPGLADTDGDGVPDGEEVGDVNNPNDRDGDGIIDALESRLPTADADGDCIPDEYDPENDVFTDDMSLIIEANCLLPGVCDTGKEHITARCVDGVPQCDYSAVPNYESSETSCDGLDNDCDGKVDFELNREAIDECPKEGVCASAQINVVCEDGEWKCDFSQVTGYEAEETLCDGLDNDCDGETDEGLVDQDCEISNDYGTCSGTTVCDSETKLAICDADTPAEEICDGLDNNCNGEIDEGLDGQPCELKNEFGTCPGTTECDAEKKEVVCVGEYPSAEICDGIDNDCNGETDENDVCGGGFTTGVYGRLLTAFNAKPLIHQGPTNATPVAGAKVYALTEEECEMGPSSSSDYETLSLEDGTFSLPLASGTWCLFVTAEGYVPFQSWFFNLTEGDRFPIDLLLTRTDASMGFGAICGRIQEKASYDPPMPSPPLRAIGDEGEAEPVGDATVRLLPDGVTSLVSATTDSRGFFCFNDWQSYVSGESKPLTLQVVKDGYYTSSKWTFTPSIGELQFHNIEVSVADETEEGVCFTDSFDHLPDPGGKGPAAMPQQGPKAGEEPRESGRWEVEKNPSSNNVYWTHLYEYTPMNFWVDHQDDCISVPSDEYCVSGEPGCELCYDEEQTGCIPAPGSLPRAYSGLGVMYFGNSENGCYLTMTSACNVEGPVEYGSLISPEIRLSEAVGAKLYFRTIWEVESFNPNADRLIVEALNSGESIFREWIQIASLKPYMTVDNPDSRIPMTSGGYNKPPKWVEHVIDLDRFEGDWMKIRFRFDSVDGYRNAFRGWMIDDVSVKARGCPTPAVP